MTTPTSQMARARKITRPELVSALEASPQFTEEAMKARLIDRVGYDDEARAAATARAGAGARIVRFGNYARDAVKSFGQPNIAIVEGLGRNPRRHGEEFRCWAPRPASPATIFSPRHPAGGAGQSHQGHRAAGWISPGRQRQAPPTRFCMP